MPWTVLMPACASMRLPIRLGARTSPVVPHTGLARAYESDSVYCAGFFTITYVIGVPSELPSFLFSLYFSLIISFLQHRPASTACVPGRPHCWQSCSRTHGSTEIGGTADRVCLEERRLTRTDVANAVTPGLVALLAQLPVPILPAHNHAICGGRQDIRAGCSPC